MRVPRNLFHRHYLAYAAHGHNKIEAGLPGGQFHIEAGHCLEAGLSGGHLIRPGFQGAHQVLARAIGPCGPANPGFLVDRR